MQFAIPYLKSKDETKGQLVINSSPKTPGGGETIIMQDSKKYIIAEPKKETPTAIRSRPKRSINIKKSPSYHEEEYSEVEDNDSYQYEIIESDGGYIVTRPSDETMVDETIVDEMEAHEYIANESQVGQKGSSEVPAQKRQKLTIETRNNTSSSGVTTTAIVTGGNSNNIGEIQEEIPVLCPDELFFKSLLPDVMMMNADQKRKFKLGVLNLIDKILSA